MAFLPMLFIASAYYYMNRADPDCGTTFSWVTRAMGPWAGWMGGWAIIVADIIVMANLAQIAGLYTLPARRLERGRRVDLRGDPRRRLWIAVMTAICVIGIELSARTQVFLLGAELITLALFAIVALIKVAAGDAGPNAVDPSLSMVQPVRHRQLRRVGRRHPDRGLHLLGLGLDGHGQRGERGLQRDAGQGGDRRRRSSSLGIYVLVAIAAQSLQRRPAS